MKKTLTILFILLTFSFLYAGKIDKAFKALESYDYFGAKELFEKTLENDIVAAPFGLSIIYSKDNNPFYNLDSAYKYISIADINFSKLDEKEKEDILKFKIDSTEIERFKDSIDKRVYLTIKDSRSVNDFNTYLGKHRDSEFKSLVKARRNDLAFEEAKDKNTAKGYELFYLTYSDASEVNEAKNRYEERLFKESTSNGKAADYSYFIKKNPESPYVNEAQDSVYAIYTREKTVKNYYKFIIDNPKNYHVDNAWRNMYKLYTADYSPQRIIEFRIEYPDYPYVEELKLDMKLAAKEFLPFQENKKWGFMDREGDIMVPPNFDYVESYSEGLALVIKNQKLGFIDKAGKIIIPIDYDDGESFKGGFAIVSTNNLYGMIDRTNKPKVPLRYELIGSFKSNLALVANETAYGYVNKTAKEIIPLKLDYATDFQNGYALVEIDDYKGIINSVGKLVVPAKYQYLENFNRYNVATAKNDSLFGLLNKSGGEQLPFIYDQIGEFSNGLALVAKEGKYGYVDRIGEIKIPVKYNYNPEALVWGKMESGYAKFLEKGKYGVIDSVGNEVFPALFEDIGKYRSNELVAVKKRGKWGYTNNSLKLIIPYNYEYAYSFHSDKAIVKMDSLWGVIDVKGKWLIEPKYDAISELDSIGFNLKSGLSYGVIAAANDTLINFSYKSISQSKYSNLLKLEQESSTYYFDFKKMKFIRPKN